MTLILKSSQRIPAASGPLVLAVMDGVGVSSVSAAGDPGEKCDAVKAARLPTLTRLTEEASYRTLFAHGTHVGLPSDDDMGNSEVGHNAMGAGRIYVQGAALVEDAMQTGSIFTGPVWKAIRERCRERSTLHLLGLLSDGNVHSHERHLVAILEQAARDGIPRIFVHVLLDGRDVAETSALIYVERLETLLAELNQTGDCRYRIASGGGRMVTTMDRYENDWRIVERGYRAQVHGEGRTFASATEAIETYRAEEPGIIDQYLPPFVVAEDDQPVGRMKDGDTVVLFNFRGDRALQVSRAFEEGDAFDKFDRSPRPDLHFAGMTLYDGEFHIPRTYLVPPPSIEKTVSEYLASAGVTQFAISETQKFGHVTYFWNGNRGGRFDEQTETYEEIPSDQVPFDQKPAMKAAAITDRMLEVLGENRFRFLRLNYPNGDMVGHTGRFEATVASMEAMDGALGRLWDGVKAAKGTLVVTADHGNAEEMLELDAKGNVKRDEAGKPRTRTSHTTNPVGLWIHRVPGPQLALREDLPEAGLANLAATLLEILGYEPPEGYLPSVLA